MGTRLHDPTTNATHQSGAGQAVDDDETQTEHSTEATPPSEFDKPYDPEALAKTMTATSTRERMSLWQEVLFVAVICSAQLHTRECHVFQSVFSN